MSVESSALNVERSAPRGAVFLSYASQDAEAAKRIADTLRSAGVEVWFDAEGGLETGDEWDAKIRRQIKECVLFLPIISANTQAREEGYFRIEWDLAAERARGIASGVAFILPIVIDDTREAGALVPDRFRSVQWTRLPGGEVTPEVKSRFLKLWSHRAGMAKQALEAGRPRPAEEGRGGGTPPPPAKSRGRTVWIAAAIVAVLIAGALGRRYLQRAPVSATAAQSEPTADFPRDPELRRVRALLFTLDAIPEDFRLAEDILKPVLAQRPNDPEVVTVAAELNQEFLSRGFDTSPTRRAQVQRLAERAVQLAPENPYAVGTMARYLLFIGGQLTRAEELIRKAIALSPDEARFHRTLHYILFLTRPAAETDAYGERMAAQFPRDPLVSYDIARRFKDSNDLIEMEAWFDRTLEREPDVAFALIWKAWLAAWAHGDLAAMKQFIDRVPERQRNNTRVINARYVHALLSGDTREALRALNELADDWLTDFELSVPKTLLAGNLALLDGRKDLARVQFEAALATVGSELERNQNDARPLRAKLWTLIGLGRLEEARAIQRVHLQSLNRPYRTNITRVNWANPIISCLLLDLRADALSLIRDSSGDANCRRILRNLFKLDPRLAPWREDPEITALLAEPVARKSEDGGQKIGGSTPVDQKSVAVLAFANLSDDKANEYFSDGISEELLNVLAKVPGLTVRGRSSAFYFKGKQARSAEIGQQLAVEYLVQGSVRRSGDRVRISAQLIRAATDEVLWSSGSLDRDLKDIFAVQDEIARLIAQNLQLKLGDGRTIVKAVNPEAHRLVLEGRHFLAQRGEGNFARGEAAFRAAAEIAPDMAVAHAGWAEVLAQRGRYQQMAGLTAPGSQLEEVQRHAMRALQLDPSLSEPHAALAVALVDAGHLAEAEVETGLGIAANPNYGSQYLWRSHLHIARGGRLDLALVDLQRATDLDPLAFIHLYIQGAHLGYAGRWAEALPLLDRGASLRGERFLPLEGERALARFQTGRREEAMTLARTILADPELLTLGWWTIGETLWVLRQGGAEDEAVRHGEAILARLAPDNYLRGYVLCGLGRFEEGLPLLRNIPTIARNRFFFVPIFDPARETPAFQRLISDLKVETGYTLARATLARLKQEAQK